MIEDEEEEKAERRNQIWQVLEQEGVQCLYDEEETAKMVQHHLKQMVKMQQEEQEEEVLRTKIVSVNEFLKEPEKWKEAVQAELFQLFEEKKALVKATLQDLQKMKENQTTVELIPSKLVITIKPGPRRKIRVVACGNFVEFKGEELFAAGADSSALRLTLKTAATKEWDILTVDIRVAFLNAPLTTTMKDGSEDGNAVFALKPPHLLVRLGYASSQEVWIAEKAMYGLRQSPRSWALHRDQTLQSLTIQGLQLRQASSEANLWVVKDAVHRSLKGIILVYVDDMLITGETYVAEVLLAAIQKQWQTSEPERVTETLATKFLGMEICRKGGAIKASQEAFVTERLPVNLGPQWEEVKESFIPCGRDIVEIFAEEEVSEEDIKEAQRIVGELLWLVTRTRVDLMYVTAKLSQWVLKAPKEVKRISKQIWGYLKRTRAQGLLFTKEVGVGWAGEDQLGLQSYSDASFAPAGQISVGSVIVCWNGSPMMWRAGKQAFPTLSAAEAELVEATEGMVMGDAFDALLGDLFSEYPKSLMIDNQAAIQLISEESGAWRTRHLRLRANHLRWRITRVDWRINHCPGSVMVADIGTKPLLATRLDDLKALLGMSLEVIQRKMNKKEAVDDVVIKKVLRLLTVATLIEAAKGQGSDDEGPERRYTNEETTVLFMVMAAYTFVVILAVMIIQRFAVIWENFTLTNEERRARAIREAEREFRDAEMRASQAQERLKRLREDDGDQLSIEDARRSSRRSSNGSSNRRDRYERTSEESGYQPTPRSGRSNYESEREEEDRRDDSMSTRSYGRRSSTRSRDRRFSAFPASRWVRTASEGGESSGSSRLRGPREDEVQGAGGAFLHPELPEGEDQIGGQGDQAYEDPQEHLPEQQVLPGDGESDGHVTEGTPIQEEEEHLPILQEEGGEEEEQEHDPSPPVTPEDFGSAEPDLEPQVGHAENQLQGGGHGREGLPRRDDHGLRQGEDGRGGQVPADRGDGGNAPGGQPDDWIEVDAPNYSVWVTAQGGRYHTSTRCPTLANTRRIALCPWCPICGHRQAAPRFSPVHVRSPGDEAHHDRRCPRAGTQVLRMYPFCQRCDRVPEAVPRPHPVRRPRNAPGNG